MSTARIPAATFLAQPWRIHDIAADFTVEDVWALPTPGGPDDFPRLIALWADADAYDNPSFVVRTMMSIRWKLGALLGWDGDDDGLDHRVHSLRERLPDDLRDGPAGPATPKAPFRPVYLTDNEFVGEMANKTVHGLAHASWVPDSDGTYHGQLAVLTKPNGLFGHLYMAGIKPFRHLIVYPALLRHIAKQWRRHHP